MRTVFCIVLGALAGCVPALGQSTASCNETGAIRTEITRIADDGTFLLTDGLRLRLANIVWPDHAEPLLRQKLLATIRAALKDQHIRWKPAAVPDRWGLTPAYLFVSEPEARLSPFLLQAGLVEKGIVPAWPDVPSGPCWSDIQHHERIAILARRGHWAPRAQAARHRALDADRDLHTGRKIVALWRIDSVRPWRGLHFFNVSPKMRSGPSLSMTGTLVSRLTQAGDNPREWRGRTLIARSILPPTGLSRLRIESLDHIGQVQGTRPNQGRLQEDRLREGRFQERQLKETPGPATTPP